MLWHGRMADWSRLSLFLCFCFLDLDFSMHVVIFIFLKNRRLPYAASKITEGPHRKTVQGEDENCFPESVSFSGQ